MNSDQQKLLRSKLFRHLDGIVISPTAYALKKQGITDFLLEKKKVELSELTTKFRANEGYLNVALRGLCSQGWLTQKIDNQTDTIIYETNEASEIAFNYFHLYEDVTDLLKMTEDYHSRKFEIEPFLKLESIYKKYKTNYGLELSKDKLRRKIEDQILTHIEGVIVGPTIVGLGITGMFHKYFMQSRFSPEEFHKDHIEFDRLLVILTDLGWFDKKNNTYSFTNVGLFFAKRATAYGVTVSYIPTLRKLDDLIFGDPLILKNITPGSEEKHVDREMNIWGSGGAHSAYFKVLDEIVIDIFNRPIEEQPEGILDMGCGNGAFLQHLFSVIERHTLRGTLLDEYPLKIVGVDYNEAAIKVSKANLINADIWAKIIWGDIGNPEQLATDLKENYEIELSELLNVRTFLDHNRIWNEPQTKTTRISSSTGAYAYEGKRINNNLVAESLKEHIEKWTPYVKKFGLLLIELHTVNPELVAQNIGNTAATAYDLTHGYSDQYILEIDEFLEVVQEAGLIPDMYKFRKFPNTDYATVSISLLKAKD
ncbi:class I SAM-dependent methyltransferase [Marinigracilibium pacificum]|uniref:Class I SAM-dependent methyltransferase n=1 Tax=Marinigracilibium pacificum TaxID=2729599 RepID=A0A848IUE1_9BACT|nr:class I SAM-dependent methyltransferase [Marinigracilibium pacificum]NMM48123.1 class I SAM-dependent methyltransferase [Marinigracilibium pacificum]